MLETLKYQIVHLLDFRGRDARQTFWYWFLLVFILNLLVGIAMSLPMMASGMATAMAGARAGDPRAAEAAMMAEMASYMRPLMIGGVVLGLLNLVLMAAPFVRRLHDSGKSGIWAAIAGLIYLASLWLSFRNADNLVAMTQEMAGAIPSERMAMQAEMARQSLLGYIPLIMVIVLGILKSDPGPNRYGEESVRF